MAMTDLSIPTASTAPLSHLSPIQKVDWQAPWLQHLTYQPFMVDATEAMAHASVFASVAAYLNQGLTQAKTKALMANDESSAATDNSALTSGRGQTLNFVAQDDLPEGMAYESFIATTGGVPTRENLHDLFNGSIWLTFPQSKALLNRYQAQAIDEAGISGSRGRVRDTITVFDENGAVLVTTEPAIGEALANFDWQNCLVQPRGLWDHPMQPNANAKAAVYIFGHALLEQLIEPRKPLCAHTLILTVSPKFFSLSTPQRMAQLDQILAVKLAEILQDEAVTPRVFSPLPILGVPHYWPENANPSFYDDTFVFRSGRRSSKK
jgi:hypothetical protein